MRILQQKINKTSFSFGDNISGYVKLGAKTRNKDRNKNSISGVETDGSQPQEVMSAYPGIYTRPLKIQCDIALSKFLLIKTKQV
jgi:hypothetical protein